MFRKDHNSYGVPGKGANSIFTGDKLLTMPNPDTSEDHQLTAYLGLKAPEPDKKCDEVCQL
jgi:biotin synthase